MQYYSNFITPPDFVDNDFPSVLIVDADWNDVESVALWCKTAPINLNIYVYSDIMLDEEWLMDAMNRCQIILVNMATSAVDHMKKHMIKSDKTWYYGDKTFLGNKNKISLPIDYFVRTYG
jgi:hypothetical protein